jgi:hypothetical protein
MSSYDRWLANDEHDIAPPDEYDPIMPCCGHRASDHPTEYIHTLEGDYKRTRCPAPDWEPACPTCGDIGCPDCTTTGEDIAVGTVIVNGDGSIDIVHTVARTGMVMDVRCLRYWPDDPTRPQGRAVCTFVGAHATVSVSASPPTTVPSGNVSPSQ